MCLILGKTRTFPQKNGRDVQLRIYGDEFYARYETMDGYTVLYDTDKQQYCFAALAKGHLISSGAPIYKPVPRGLVRHLQEAKQVRNQKFDARYQLMRPKKSPPPGVSATLGRNNGLLPGTQLSREPKVKGLTILINFQDVTTDITRADVDNLLNGDNYTAHGNACSVKEYYRRLSSNRLEYTNTVVGPVTLEKNRTHYINTPCMQEALDLAVSQFGVDLRDFDCKNRGVVDAINFLYAGETLYEEWLWPHNYSMAYSHNGMRTDLYTIQSLGRKPVDMKIGTFCHEAGHLICRFPDLYDYGSRDGDSDPSAGMGYFCLMAGGSHLSKGRFPAPISGYLRNLAGWADNEIILNNPGRFQAKHADYNTVHKYLVDNKPNEYFIIENRTRMGLDTHCKSSGLSIYHCDTLGSNEWQGGTADKHYQCALIQADGARNLENNRNQGDENDLFKQKEGLVLSRDTIPSSRAWGGMESGLKVYNISEPGEVIFFETGSPQEPEGNGETIIKESRPSLLIPDLDPKGITDQIDFFKPGTIERIRVSIDISHTYIQDLQVELETPWGQRIVLADKEGGAAQDLCATYDSDTKLAALKGKCFAGPWKLHVKDLAKRDTGKLNQWKIELDYTLQEKTLKKEKIDPLAIPDKDATGINSTLSISETGKITQATIYIELTHSYHGDLAVTLTSPSGKSVTLIAFNSLGTNQGLLSKSFSTTSDPKLSSLVSEKMQGDWTLNLADNWKHDTGSLKKWAMELAFEDEP
jgi:M6 family metalloprotease-like protein